MCRWQPSRWRKSRPSGGRQTGTSTQSGWRAGTRAKCRSQTALAMTSAACSSTRSTWRRGGARMRAVAALELPQRQWRQQHRARQRLGLRSRARRSQRRGTHLLMLREVVARIRSRSSTGASATAEFVRATTAAEPVWTVTAAKCVWTATATAERDRTNGRKTFTYCENVCLVPLDISYSYRVWSYAATKSRICLECSESILRIQANAHDFNKDSILEGVVYVCCRRFDWMRRGSPKQRDQNRSQIQFETALSSSKASNLIILGARSCINQCHGRDTKIVQFPQDFRCKLGVNLRGNQGGSGSIPNDALLYSELTFRGAKTPSI